jgi:hypothetical protein
MAATMGAVRVLCGAEKERVVATHKAPGACPRCGGAVIAIDVESERRILGRPTAVPQEQAQVLLHQVPPPPRHPLRLRNKLVTADPFMPARRKPAGRPVTDR